MYVLGELSGLPQIDPQVIVTDIRGAPSTTGSDGPRGLPDVAKFGIFWRWASGRQSLHGVSRDSLCFATERRLGVALLVIHPSSPRSGCGESYSLTHYMQVTVRK